MDVAATPLLQLAELGQLVAAVLGVAGFNGRLGGRASSIDVALLQVAHVEAVEAGQAVCQGAVVTAIRVLGEVLAVLEIAFVAGEGEGAAAAEEHRGCE